MALPLWTPYNFTSFQTASPSEPLPAPDLDAEFVNVLTELTELWGKINGVTNPDGTLKNESVGEAQLQPGLLDDALADQISTASGHAAAASASASAASSHAATAATTATNVANYTAGAIGARTAAEAARDQALASEALAKSSETKASIAQLSAQQLRNEALTYRDVAYTYTELAEAWAEKIDGPVDDGLYSAKWWALQAQAAGGGGGALPDLMPADTVYAANDRLTMWRPGAENSATLVSVPLDSDEVATAIALGFDSIFGDRDSWPGSGPGGGAVGPEYLENNGPAPSAGDRFEATGTGNEVVAVAPDTKVDMNDLRKLVDFPIVNDELTVDVDHLEGGSPRQFFTTTTAVASDLDVANPINQAEGATFTIRLPIDGTGGHTISLGTNFRVFGPAISTAVAAPNGVIMLHCYIVDPGDGTGVANGIDTFWNEAA